VHRKEISAATKKIKGSFTASLNSFNLNLNYEKNLPVLFAWHKDKRFFAYDAIFFIFFLIKVKKSAFYVIEVNIFVLK
jgi:hypothetical protein